MIHNLLAPSFESNNASPHCIIELSTRLYKRMKGNIIMVHGMHMTHEKLIAYDRTEYGRNITHRQVNGIKVIDLSRMKYRCLLVATKKEECVTHFKDKIFVIDNNLDLKNPNTNEHATNLSGFVLLCLAVLKKSKMNSLLGQQIEWGRLIREMASMSKPNIMASPSMSHNESDGWYYSFGNRGAFQKINNSSVSQYSVKKSTNHDKQEEIKETATAIEKIISVELKCALNTISTILPNIQMLISPVLDVGYDLQHKHGDIGMKLTSNGRGCWSSHISVNATTGLFHNEDDCTYTTISVPSQKKINRHYQFLFQFSEGNTIGIDMTQNVSFVFSGKLLTHRQSSYQTGLNSNESDVFLNVSSYGPKRLFSHIRKSFERNKAS